MVVVLAPAARLPAASALGTSRDRKGHESKIDWKRRRGHFWSCLSPTASVAKKRLVVQPFVSTNNVGLEFNDKEYADRSDSILHVQTLRDLPIEKLYGAVVMVRFDSAVLLSAGDSSTLSLNRALFTIKYLYHAGAKVVLVSNWLHSSASMLLSEEKFADHLSSLLKVKVVPANGVSAITQFKMNKLEEPEILLLNNLTHFREEVANSIEFSKLLSNGVSIFVNDAFSLSHRILASTVGVARFCHASVAGFHFEEEYFQLMKISESKKQPYFAIIGGSNFQRKADALCFLASTCDGLVFLGKLAFQIINGFGLPTAAHLVEYGAVEGVLKLIKLAQHRKISIYFQKDFLCVNIDKPELMKVFNYNDIMPGWTPLDLGPISLKEISALLLTCKKVLLIGLISSGSLKEDTDGTSQLPSVLERISKDGCDVILVGNAACEIFSGKSSSLNQYSILKNASVVWEFLRGTRLPGVAALDRAYPYILNWDSIFADPTKPLMVDIGSGIFPFHALDNTGIGVESGTIMLYLNKIGNGLFILKMAGKCTKLNFLGLEINDKLVRRCLDDLLKFNLSNSYFVSTDATSTFRSIVSSYPGDLVLVTIQCPNPDFNREDQRRRMLQRTLVEAIVDLLITNGKVFLQSDIEAVTMRMKNLFLTCGKGKLLVDGDGMGWMEENPFGVQTDWEQHVIERGAPMYRIMLKKVQ